MFTRFLTFLVRRGPRATLAATLAGLLAAAPAGAEAAAPSEPPPAAAVGSGGEPGPAEQGAPDDDPTSGADPLEAFRCPGDDPGFWMDMTEHGWVGYGETWDLHTCSEGVEFYAEGTNRKWKAMRPRLAHRVKPLMSEGEVLYYTTILPYMAFVSLGLVFALAWLMAFIGRFKKVPIHDVTCASCGTTTPVTREEGGVFCPSCGSAVPLPLDSSGRGAPPGGKASG